VEEELEATAANLTNHNISRVMNKSSLKSKYSSPKKSAKGGYDSLNNSITKQ
jgi:hypothetical protein